MTNVPYDSAWSPEHQRLMELVEAEDASNGEVGCGRNWGSRLPVYLQTCHINVEDTAFRELLREHLGHRLMEVDFDRIVRLVRTFIEPIVVNAHIQGTLIAVQPIPTEPLIEEIPNEELQQRFKADLGEVCSQAELEQIVTFTHYVIHEVLLKSSLDLMLTVQQ
jgi:hypothetical protein